MKKYFLRMIYISIVGMLFTAVSNANLGIVSEIASQNKNQWVGPLSVGLLFMGSGLGALYNKYIGKYKYRNLFLFGSIGWFIYLTFSVLFLFLGFETYLILIILFGSFICGGIMSTYYNSLNNYVNILGQVDNSSTLYFGISVSIIQCSNIVGNGVSALLIEPLGQKTYSIVMLSLIIFIAALFIFVKNTEQNPEQKPLVNKQFTINQAEQRSVLSSSQQNRKQQKVIPKLMFFCFSFQGIMISFVYTQFSILFYKYYKNMPNQQLNHLTFVTFMIQGTGQCLGGLMLAVFAHKIPRKTLYFNIFGDIFILTVIGIWLGFENDMIWLIKLSGFFLGVSNCFCFSSSLSIAGIWDQSGFSLFNFGQSFTVAIFALLYIFFSIETLIVIYFISFLFSTYALNKHKAQIDQLQTRQ